MRPSRNRCFLVFSILAMLLLSSCALSPLEVFMSPNPPFEDDSEATVQPQAQSSQAQQRLIIQETVPQPTAGITPTPGQMNVSPDQGVSYIFNQVNEALAEASAHLYAGEARLQEDNILEAIREFELARQLVERDVDPGLHYIQQVPKVQGGASILSEQRLQSLHIQRQSILGRINQAYDFQALYQRHQQTDRVNTLREQNKATLQPVVVSTGGSVKKREDLLALEEYVVDEYVVIEELALAVPQADVETALEKFQQRRATFHAYLLRANQYAPIVRSILSTHGVPAELAYVGLVVSGYQPTVKDPSSNKVGIWQLSTAVSKRYGLQINSQQDERQNVEASTSAFARYMRDLYNRFNSWDLAIMAYEMGEDALQRTINRAGSYDAQVVRGYVGKTSLEGALLPKLAAAILIARHPGDYGFHSDRLQTSGSQPNQPVLPRNAELNETPVTTILNQ